jgi:prophage tail gpP-like protein
MSLLISGQVKRGTRIDMTGRAICQKLFEVSVDWQGKIWEKQNAQKVAVQVYRPHGLEVHSLQRIDEGS